MSTEPNFTNTIEEWTIFFIPLPDGIQLAARAWLPTDAIEYPVSYTHLTLPTNREV